MEKIKVAIGYIRCSSDEQTNDSVPRQQTEIERWATSKEYKILKFFIDDGISGTIPLGERPAGRKLIEEIQVNKEIDYVIIWEYSRWGRDADSEQIYYWELHLNQFGVKLISLDNPELTFKSAMERGIMRFVQRQTSTQENKAKSLRSYSGGKRNIELGFLNTNNPPYGYIRAAKNITSSEVRLLKSGEMVQKKYEKPFLAIQPSQADVVKRIFSQRSAGLSLRAIAKYLNQDGIPSAKGKRWRKNVIDKMLRNPIYYGAACWNKTTSSRILAYEDGREVPRNIKRYTRQTDKKLWNINETANLPAIVSKQIWLSANSIKLSEPRQKGKSASSQYLLSGLIFCAKSGSSMVGSDGGHYKRKDNTMLKKRYYINNNYHSQGILEGVRSIDADILEKKIIDAIKDGIQIPEIVEILEKLSIHCLKEMNLHSQHHAKLSGIENQIKEKEKAINNLLKAIQQADDIDSLTESLRCVENEKRALEIQKSNQIESMKTVNNIPEPDEIGRLAAKYLLEFNKSYGDAPIEEKKQALRHWVNKIEVREEEGKKKVRALINILPKTSEFQSIYDEFVLCGPCRTRTYDQQIMSLLL